MNPNPPLTIYYLLSLRRGLGLIPRYNHLNCVVARSYQGGDNRLQRLRNDPLLVVSADLSISDYRRLRRYPQHMSRLKFRLCTDDRLRYASIVDWYMERYYV